MHKRYISLSLFIFIYYLGSFASRIQFFKVTDLSDITFKDTESIIAIGERFPLSTSTLADLIMISGISDRIAFDILKEKDTVIALSRTEPLDDKYKTLEIVKGIGPKKAQLLSNYLDLRP